MMKRMLVGSTLVPIIALAATACGADVCDASAADVAGTWTFVAQDSGGGDGVNVTLEISADGDVDVDIENGDPLDCELVQDQLCDLEVRCTSPGEDGVFTFTVQRRD